MPATVPADRICIPFRRHPSYSLRCSLVCSKRHKEEHPVEEEKTPALQAAQTPADGTSNAEQPDEYNKIFAKYPVLATYLNQIYDETEPPSSLTPNPDDGGKSGGLKRKQQRKPWTREIGVQNALHKLRHLRDQDTTGALKEFCALVHMLNAEKAEEDARKLEAQRDAETIAQMIRDERD
ncbi:hypothetical protein BKA67DRAFT_532118 [Truncatella angustata]|uniref:Uncharacterized protein n=1 Tax=Truncatella angustata TaxID=152316 RepID=A0A9P8URB0_9PEZI|nr:uncharacterized protein BKA67DRAFT_532118 [Truncatella angustata]KAH6656876.1 hypothetical protein BKA67DRAFT_532118 [Truncatella angustata]